MSPPERAWDLVLRHRDFYGASQHHTETMAYGVITLYLAGTSVLIFSESWLKWGPALRGSLAASVLAIAAMTAAFVLWQFEMRHFAVRMVGACTNVAARWVTAQLPPAVEFQAHTLGELEWPQAVVDEFAQRPETLLLPWGLSLLVIALWTIAAVVRIVAA